MTNVYKMTMDVELRRIPLKSKTKVTKITRMTKMCELMEEVKLTYNEDDECVRDDGGGGAKWKVKLPTEQDYGKFCK